MFSPRCWPLFLLIVSFAGKAFPAVSVPVVKADDIPVSADYILRTWATEEGLPSNRVTGLAQTPDGYLWVATQGGLTRFDGVRFTTFSAETTPGLESSLAQAVFVSRDGSLWVGMEHGAVARRADGRFQIITPASQQMGSVISFAQDASGAVWFGYETPTKIVRSLDGRLTTYTAHDGIRGAHENEVCSMGNGTIWYANALACGFFDGKRFQSVDPGGGDSVHLARAGDGGMWAKRGNWLMRYHPDGSPEIKADVSALSIHVMMEDSSGNLWVGTNNAGLLLFKDGRWEKIPVEGGAVSTLFEDREGDLWVGLRASGVIRLHPRRFYLRQIKDGLLDDDTSSLCADNQGRLWVAGRRQMLVRATDATNRSFTQPEGWPDWVKAIMAVYPDPSGGVWFGTNAGLLRYSGEWSFIRESLHDQVTALLADRTGVVWAATINGPLVRHQAGQDLRLPETNGLTHVVALAEDHAGRIWAGTENGLVFQKSGDHFLPVPLPGAKPGDFVQFIVPDGPNTVWIGAARGGLYRWRDGRVDRLPDGAGLPVETLRSLIITAEGDFWLGTWRGLLRVARDELEPVLDGRKSSLHCIGYGRDDGLSSIEFSPGFRNASATTPDGHLWFATTQGALEITPKEKPSGIIPPLPVLIETVRVGERAMAFGENSKLVIPPRSGPLEIRYTLAQLSAPERIRFRYRLSGMEDDKWIDADNQRTALFNYLPPGDYRFEVAAAEADGPWLPTTASLAFTVRAAWWETAWFRVGIGLLGALAVAAVVRFAVKRRMRARIRRFEQESALNRERARIARDMHDELGAELTHVILMSESAAAKAPSPELNRIATTARSVSSTLDQIVWMTNPRNDNLKQLVDYIVEFAEEYLMDATISLRSELPEEVAEREISSEKRHHILLAVKEALNNVAKHSGARHVHLRIAIEGGKLRIAIQDDGRGFGAGEIASTSNGLANMRQRLEFVGGRTKIDSEPGRGTIVTLLVEI